MKTLPVVATVLLAGVPTLVMLGCQKSGGPSLGRSQPSALHPTAQSTEKGPTGVVPATVPAAEPSATAMVLTADGNDRPSADKPIADKPSADKPIADKPADPATKPALEGELLAPTTGMTGYGDEVYRVVSRPDEIIAVLKNGSTVICKRVASPVVSVRGYAYTGGVYEGKWLGGGLSHLLEHLVAGGSSEKRTEEQNRDLLQKIGNDSNAYTTEGHTAFFINTTTEHMSEAADLVCGWMLGAKITTPEYRREYQVVQRELEMGKGEPDRVYYYLSASNRYHVSPAKVPVIGYQEVIQGLSRDDVYNYYKLAYVPNNLLFTVAGDLPPEKMLAAIQQQIKGAKPGREFSREIAPEPPVLSPRTLVATFPKLGQARLQLGFPTIRLTDPDVYALDLLATVLGGGESALLVQVLRDEKELVSAIGASDDTPHYVDGTFQVDMQLDPGKVAEATKVTLDLLAKVAKDGVEEARIARAKTQMKAARVKKMQTAEDVAETMATDYIQTGDAHFAEHYVEAIDKVTPEQIKAAAAKYFDPGKLLTTALLPAEFTGAAGLPKAEELLRPSAPAAKDGPAGKDSDVVRVDLGNDTILLTKRITTSPLVVMQMYSLGGLTAEDDKTNGLGNLTMQMLARGTKSMNARQLAEFWDSIGGEFDAASGNNSWNWSATCLKEDFGKAFAQFSDQVANPSFPDAEIGPMKKRIADSIQGQDADWTAQAFRFFKKTYYGPSNSPYQYMATGSQEGVEKFTAEQVRDWYARQVLAHKKVIAVYGDVDPRAVEEQIRKSPLMGIKTDLASTPKNSPATAPATRPSGPSPAGVPSVQVAQVALNKTDQALAGVVIGYRSNSVIGEPAVFPLAVGDTMASGYQYGAGYLYEILRGRGLVYVVHGQNSPGLSAELPGTFLVYAGCEPDKVNEVIDVILENIARLQGTPADVNESWFARSKELIVVAEAMENQTPAQQATQAALDELYGLGYSWHSKFADSIKSVLLPQVKEIAMNRLGTCVVTVSTPVPEIVKVRAGERKYPAFSKVELTPRGVQHDAGGK